MAVLADIHGNPDALQAVMDNLHRQSPDLVVGFGDCFSRPLDVVRTADLLADLAPLTVCGNHDQTLVSGPLDSRDAAAKPRMPQAALHRLATLHLNAIIACHATPSRDNSLWLETLTAGRFTRALLDQIAAHATGITAEVRLCGHTHIARAVQLPDGRLVVSPGSVCGPGFADPNAAAPYTVSAPYHPRPIPPAPHTVSAPYRQRPIPSAPHTVSAPYRQRPIPSAP